MAETNAITIDEPNASLEERAANGSLSNETSESQLKDEQAKKKNSFLEVCRNSYVIWAVAALIVCDLFIHVAWTNLKLDHYASPNRSMVWWNISDFRKQAKSPEIVLMGSSLLMHALHGSDAEYLGLAQNEVFHHKSVMLENLLQEKTGKKVDTFAFALAGAMASDAYALASTLFTGEHKPKVIIYNIAPRDFMDNTLSSPASTEIFRYMNHVGGARDVAWQARPAFMDKVEYGLENLSALYNHRQYLVFLQHKYAESLLRLIGYKNPTEIHTPFALRRLALLDLPEETGVNERLASPHLKWAFSDNSDEYKMRYQPFKEKPFNAQLAYLKRFLSFCKKEDIAVVLVNMPLLEKNIKLMPPGSYDLYMNNVKSLANENNARFIDMQDSKVSTPQLDCDTAHRNGQGGRKFCQRLADHLTSGSKLNVEKNGSGQ